MKKAIQGFRVGVAAMFVAMLVLFCPGQSLAQTRRVANVSSAQEFADEVVTIAAPARGIFVQQALAASWNGANRAQMDRYFRDGTPFFAPVLPNGLPTAGGELYGVGPANWLRPGSDNVFGERFRGHPDQFTSIIDLLRVNQIRVWNAGLTTTWVFLLDSGEVPVIPPQTFGMTLRRDPQQRGVPEGEVRWIATQYQGLTPNCAGRPSQIYAGSVLTPAGRTYLSSTCTQPLNASSVYALFGAVRPVPRFGVNPTVDLKVRLMGSNVRIPRSRGYRSAAETAALAIPLADVAEAELEAMSSTELKIIYDALVPATRPGEVPEDLGRAAIATQERVSTAYQHAFAREERAQTARVSGELALARRLLHDQMHRGDVNGGRATRHARERNVLAILVVAMAFAIFWLVVRRRRGGTEFAKLQLDLKSLQEGQMAERSAIKDGLAVILAVATGYLEKLNPDDPAISEHVTSARLSLEKINELGEAAPLKERLSLVESVLHALGLKTPMTRAADPIVRIGDEDVSLSVLMGAYRFYRSIANRVYSDVRARACSRVQNVRDLLMVLSGASPVEVWQKAADAAVDDILETCRMRDAFKEAILGTAKALAQTKKEYALNVPPKTVNGSDRASRRAKRPHQQRNDTGKGDLAAQLELALKRTGQALETVETISEVLKYFIRYGDHVSGAKTFEGALEAWQSERFTAALPAAHAHSAGGELAPASP